MKISKLIKKLTAVVLSLAVSTACLINVAYAEPATETIPGTTRTIKEFDPSFLSVTGFAKGNVNDRTEYIGTDKYVVADDELTFLKAIDDAAKGKVKVIEVTNDLDLGYKHLSDEAKACDCLSDYEGNISVEITSPAVMASGVSQLLLKNIDGLTIFSRSGAAIKRAEWKLQGTSKDIIIRNIKFDGMWQWTSSTKDAGWTCMKVNGAKGVWLDHCTFTMAVDGNCDSENGASGVSYTWCNFGAATDEDPDQDSTIYQTMSYMEYMYQKGSLNSDDAYYKVRKSGVPFEKFLAYTGWHHKGFLIGSGDKDYKDNEALGLQDGNQRLEVTFAYSNMENLGSRVVRMRQGKGHLFNCYVNNMAHHQLSKEYSGLGYAGFGINRCIDVHNGGSVAADTCVFYGVDQVIIGDEKNGAGGDWGTRFQNVYNYAMVANSKVTTTSGKTYTGSSWDNNGDNLFTGSFGWADKSTVGKFCWNTTIVGVEEMSRENPPTPAAPFEFNYDFDYQLPYEYQLVELDSVEEVVATHAGTYKYSEDPEFWLRTEYSADEDIKPVTEATAVEGFDTNFETIKINVDSTYQFLAEIKPSNATDREMVFTSSDTEVAEITDSGLIIAKTPGIVDITVASANGVSKTVAVEVYNKVTGITLNSKSKTITVGSDYQLVASLIPENATNTDVTWKSSNEEIATVTADGLVHAVAPGKVSITCTSVDSPDETATCRVTVKEGSGDTVTPIPDEKLMGDVDFNGTVDAADALLVLKHAAKLEILAEDACFRGNVDGVEALDASDALWILKYAAKLVDKFPVQEQGTEAPTNTPEVTESEKPVVTDTPAPTEVPATDTPEPTDVPATATPAPTDVPATDTPEPSGDLLPFSGTVYIAGDSIADGLDNRGNTDTDIVGWGNIMANYFTSDVTIDNQANAGDSTESFYYNGKGSYYKGIYDNIKENDYVIISFGHNDGPGNPWRDNVDLGSSDVNGTFQWYIKHKFIEPALAVGATPILMTPVVRCFYENGVFTEKDYHLQYAEAYRDIVAEYAEKGITIPLIDAQQYTYDLYQTLSETEALKYHATNDTTHYNKAGCERLCEYMMEFFKSNKMGISHYIK